jgi:hypothetical protein
MSCATSQVRASTFHVPPERTDSERHLLDQHWTTNTVTLLRRLHQHARVGSGPRFRLQGAEQAAATGSAGGELLAQHVQCCPGQRGVCRGLAGAPLGRGSQRGLQALPHREPAPGAALRPLVPSPSPFLLHAAMQKPFLCTSFAASLEAMMQSQHA